MLYQDEDNSEDIGLFTFYREQAQKEEQLKRVKQLRKQMGNQFIDQFFIGKQSKSLFHSAPRRPNLIAKKEQQYKLKSVQPKQRYHESVVDMGKQIGPQKQFNSSFHKIRFKEPSFIAKNKKYRQKIDEINFGADRQGVHFQEEGIPNQIKIQSYHRRQMSDDLNSSRTKPVIHSVRGSVVELPEIKKSVEMPYKPKKSIKSRLIQQAMKLKDKEKIKNIREYLKASPTAGQIQDEEIQDLEVDSGAFAVFQQHQQKILGIIRRFRRVN